MIFSIALNVGAYFLFPKFRIYTIRPIQEALELNYQRQFLRAERDIERAKAEKRLAELNRQNKKEESA